MSSTVAAASKALANDPELLAKVTTAGSAEERAAHFRAAGVEVPTHADVNAHFADMAGVAGGQSAQDQNTEVTAGVAAVAASAA
jgi:hypothetical protein